MPKESVAERVKASKFNVPPLFANHVQLIGLGESAILEFRALIPELEPGAVREQTNSITFDAKDVELAPHTRIMIPAIVLNELANLLKANIQVPMNPA